MKDGVEPQLQLRGALGRRRRPQPEDQLIKGRRMGGVPTSSQSRRSTPGSTWRGASGAAHIACAPVPHWKRRDPAGASPAPSGGRSTRTSGTACGPRERRGQVPGLCGARYAAHTPLAGRSSLANPAKGKLQGRGGRTWRSLPSASVHSPTIPSRDLGPWRNAVRRARVPKREIRWRTPRTWPEMLRRGLRWEWWTGCRGTDLNYFSAGRPENSSNLYRYPEPAM